MHPQLDKIAHKFRSAILAGGHADAARISTEYVEALRHAWDALDAEERVVSELPKQSRELLDWARAVTITQHILAAEQLAIVEKIIRYRPADLTQARPGAVEVLV